MRYHPQTALGRRLQENRRFRIVFFAGMTLVINLVYGAGHAIVGIAQGSIWLLVMAAYYVLLGVMRFGAVLTERRQSSERHVMRFCGGMLLVLSVVLAAATSISLCQGRSVVYGMITMLAITVYTFWKMTMAIVHTVQACQSGTPLTRTIRNVTLASALASLMSMQRSMLVSFDGDATVQTALILNIFTSTVVCALVFLMGLNMLLDERGFGWMAVRWRSANQKAAEKDGNVADK